MSLTRLMMIGATAGLDLYRCIGTYADMYGPRIERNKMAPKLKVQLRVSIQSCLHSSVSKSCNDADLPDATR